MPKLKSPVVSSNVISSADFGEFHPTAQIRSICDYNVGGVFKGIDFNVPLTRSQARKYLEITEKLKPSARIEIDKNIMKDRLFAVEVFKMCN